MASAREPDRDRRTDGVADDGEPLGFGRRAVSERLERGTCIVCFLVEACRQVVAAGFADTRLSNRSDATP